MAHDDDPFALRAGPPAIRTCGTASYNLRQFERFPEFRRRQTEQEHRTAQRMLNPNAQRAGGPTKIPVVVHVVHNDPSENITAAQIKKQIAVLNKDYRGKNTDKSKVPAVWKGLVTDAGIEFALATKDPTGNATNGITRDKAGAEAFSDVDDAVKKKATGGADPWPSDRYLNIWVCNLAGGILGYASFPGGPPALDGVVIQNTAFGTGGSASAPFNLGRTATHEIGHWLNLHHIWGDSQGCGGSDSVDDTPPQEGPNFGKPAFPQISCSNGPNGDMFMNFMDYVDDGAMVMFTTQQVARMSATLEGPRQMIAGGGG